MNRKEFIASLLAIPFAIKGAVSSFTKAEGVLKFNFHDGLVFDFNDGVLKLELS